MRMVCLLLFLFCASCSVLQSDSQRGVTYGGYRDTPMTFTTADVRVITDRRGATGQRIVCTEPGPDVAKAIATSLSMDGSGGSGTANGKLKVAGASAEAVAELAGRSTALMGLRDVLYRACEAYANGGIGQDLYALIISHYGQLMSTLFLAQDMSGPLGRPGAGVDSPRVQTQGQGVGAGTNADDVETSGSRPPIRELGLSHAPEVLLEPIKAAGAGASDPAQASAGREASRDARTEAVALARMNEDFLDLSVSHGILVACINNSDPSLIRQPVVGMGGGTYRPQNTLLDGICPELLRAIVKHPIPSPELRYAIKP